MRLLEKIAFIAGLTVVGVTAIYRYVLSDEQRASLQEGADTIRKATREVTDSISPLVSDGPTKSEEEAMAQQNRERLAKQWAELGY